MSRFEGNSEVAILSFVFDLSLLSRDWSDNRTKQQQFYFRDKLL